MLTVPVPLDDDLAIEALAEARRKGLALEDFIVSVLKAALSSVDAKPTLQHAHDWLKEAATRAKAVRSAKEFKLQDLFSRDEWKNIPSPTVFGREFRKLAEQEGFARHVGKTALNQAIYRRSEA